MAYCWNPAHAQPQDAGSLADLKLHSLACTGSLDLTVYIYVGLQGLGDGGTNTGNRSTAALVARQICPFLAQAVKDALLHAGIDPGAFVQSSGACLALDNMHALHGLC